MTSGEDVPVPWWASRARTVCRLVMGLWGLLLLVRLVLALTLSQLDWRADVWRWLEIPWAAVLAVGLVSGVVWLAGAAVAGYREGRG